MAHYSRSLDYFHTYFHFQYYIPLARVFLLSLALGVYICNHLTAVFWPCSRLHITGVVDSDSGVYTCSPVGINPVSAVLHVINGTSSASTPSSATTQHCSATMHRNRNALSRSARTALTFPVMGGFECFAFIVIWSETNHTAVTDLSDQCPFVLATQNYFCFSQNPP